ncbi:MAG: menaquinol oxidoreductase [Deltaproteobacteria bacterium]|nr:MAG: menaquinol oxidoreductase [Deltaproteobacteria bacterium]RUA02091.1 MAG: menaquinol oxidoreductase [Deltaproteobacteria bacterium]
MNKHYLYALSAVIALFLVAYVGTAVLGLRLIFGVLIPYLAVTVFIVGIVYKIMGWARSAVPFCIPTTCGQQKSLPWIRSNKIDCPSSTGAVIIRMILEVTCFRSLFRNTKMRLEEGNRLTYKWEIWLWVSALAFHYAFLVVIVRHLRLFIEPVPFFVRMLENVDSFFRVEVLYDAFQVGLPGIYLSGLVLLAAVTFLLLRRLVIPQVRYISLAADYFPLFLIFGIAFTGILMRYVTKIDVTAAKTLTMGLVTLHPTVPAGIGGIFYVHLFFVSTLLAYFPFSKLMHAGGVFLSPTRNMTTNSREKRHENPWNYPVPIHTYEEYEDEFREKMVEAGLPVDKPFVKPAEEPADSSAK